MGFEKINKGPDILRSRDVELGMGEGSKVVSRSREGLEHFYVPGIELCESEQPSKGYVEIEKQLVTGRSDVSQCHQE